MGLVKVAHQFRHIVGKPVTTLHPTPQRMIDGLIPTGRASQTKIDPVAVDRGQGPELLGNGQRRVVGQHDPPCAHTD